MYIYMYDQNNTQNEQIRKLVSVRTGMAAGHKDKGNE